MLRGWKIFFQLIILLTSCKSYGQKDSIKKQQVFLSFNVGLPLYNQFNYYVDNYYDSKKTAFTKTRPSYNFSFEHNIKHFTINFLYSYTHNEFNGSPYLIQGKELYTRYHNSSIYKELEIYQKVNYNNFQYGFGLGYNHWIQKHNIAITINILQNIFDRVFVSSYYVKNSSYNDQDTTAITLVKNQRNSSSERGMFTVDDLGIYANMKIVYSYSLYKNLFLHFALSGSYGLLNNYSSTNTPYYDNGSLGYHLLSQKIVSCNFGIRYKLF